MTRDEFNKLHIYFQEMFDSMDKRFDHILQEDFASLTDKLIIIHEKLDCQLQELRSIRESSIYPIDYRDRQCPN